MIKIILLSTTSLILISSISIILKAYIETKKFVLRENVVFGSAVFLGVIQLAVIALWKINGDVNYLVVAIINLLNVLFLIFLLLYFIFLGRDRGGAILVRYILPFISIVPTVLLVTSLIFLIKLRITGHETGISSISEVFGILSTFVSGVLASLIASVVYTVLLNK